MPPLETCGRHQKVVYWAASGNYDVNGEPIVIDPVQLVVRWELREEEVLDSKGNTVLVEGNFVTDQDIIKGSVLWLGALADLPGTGSDITDFKRIVAFSKIPGLKARQFRRKAFFVFYSDEMPTVR